MGHRRAALVEASVGGGQLAAFPVDLAVKQVEPDEPFDGVTDRRFGDLPFAGELADANDAARPDGFGDARFQVGVALFPSAPVSAGKNDTAADPRGEGGKQGEEEKAEKGRSDVHLARAVLGRKP
ncbi:MAG: hypothetical protein GXP48_05615 [Acidobacteria bacterium]|nr:hypothetical protein [Acidobacteriota bacterium]